MSKTIKKIVVLFLIFSAIILPVSPNSWSFNFVQAGNIEIDDQDNPTVWDQDQFIDEKIIINEGAELIIKDGVDITFTGEYGGISIAGKLTIEGNRKNKTVISGKNFSIMSYDKSQVNISYAEIVGGGYDVYMVQSFFKKAYAGIKVGVLNIVGGKTEIDHTTFKNNLYVITNHTNSDESLKINYSKFIDNDFDVIDDNQSDLTKNYWDDLSGSDTCKENQNVSSCLSKSEGAFEIYPWQESEDFDEEEEASNVLFLPGIKASHLYKYKSGNMLDELWIPNWFGNDVEELKLDSDGESIENVFARKNDVLETTVKGNIYESFMDDLREMKEDGTIDDYNAFAYDWRQSVKDIVENGTPYENYQTARVLSEIDNLAQTSKSGKVTIVAHSNGGLVAKMIMKEIEDNNLENKIDKVIMVGTPQMGTPISILSFLYGYEESLPTLLSQEDARELIENMPGAYGLLPSEEYLDRLEEDFINFSSENTERGQKFIEAYGNKINSFDEFKSFLLGEDDDREKPEKDETDLENTLNKTLLNEAIALHDESDNFIWPEDTKLIQIAGWGLDTIKGIDYVEEKNKSCLESKLSKIPVCVEEKGSYTLIPEPKITGEGDEVVVAPSALMMEDNDENVERYWFNLFENNRGFSINRRHKNILEIDELREFIESQIQNEEAELPEYMSDSKPEITNGISPRIRMALYSPLDIHACDSEGNCVGYGEVETEEGMQKIVDEDLNNSYYFQLGERKYLGFDESNGDVEIKLDGYGEGAYTLRIEEVQITEEGENVINQITYKNLPTSEETKVSLTIPESGLENISNLEADYDGDGENDYVIESQINQENTLPDMIAPEIEIISPENRKYKKDETLEISLNVSDNKSEAENITVEKFLDGEKINEDKIDLFLLKNGKHILSVQATDEAGNQTEQQTEFEIFTDIKTLRKGINHFYDLGLIKSSQERKMLDNNLEVIQKEIEFYHSIENNKFLKKKTKEKILETLEKVIQKHLDIVNQKIQRDKKNYATMIKEVILDDIEFIKNNF